MTAKIVVKSPSRVLNKHGKENRNVGKKLLLASTYGMGPATAGANMGKTAEEGKILLDNFFAGFPQLKKAIDDSKTFLRQHEYVEDFIGRRRRIPEINLEPYTITLDGKNNNDNFNPIIGCSDRQVLDPKIIKWRNIIDGEIKKRQQFFKKMADQSGDDYEESFDIKRDTLTKIIAEAAKEGVTIKANTARIAQAARQCFNARVQGSAASLTKIAMVDISNDELLREYGAKLIIPVHDELLVECPEYYAEEVTKRLPEVMIAAAKRVGNNTPQACDPYCVTRWAADYLAGVLMDEFNKLTGGDPKKGVEPMSPEEAINKICNKYEELPREAIIETLKTGNDLEF